MSAYETLLERDGYPAPAYETDPELTCAQCSHCRRDYVEVAEHERGFCVENDDFVYVDWRIGDIECECFDGRW